MNLPSPRNDNTVILIVGTLLGLYLVVLIGFAYFKQGHLRESLIQQERLNAEKQAISVALFFTHRQAEIEKLANDRRIRQYLDRHQKFSANSRHENGDSLALHELLTSALAGRQTADEPSFSSISLIESGGHVLLRVDDNDDADPVYATNDLNALEAPQVRREPYGNLFTFTAPIQTDDKTGAVVVAEMDTSELVRHFLVKSDTPRHNHQTALVGADDRVIAASDTLKWHDWRSHSLTTEQTVIDVPIPNTTMRIVTLPDTVIDGVFLASPMLVAALAVTLLPLFAGMVYLWRLNTHNLVLKTSIQTASQQRALLRAQNRRMQREINRRIESEQKLVHHTNYDQLTGLPNRNLALDRLTQAIKWAKRENGCVLVMFLDLDRFKQINDSLGHTAGDELLREAAQRLRAKVSESDTVARLGGDEFLVICPELPRNAEWEGPARDLLKVLAAPFYVGGHEFFVSASIGACAYPDGGSEPQRLLKNADIAMSAAKERGRNRCCLYEPSMDAMTLESLKLEHHLRHALQNRELRLCFQPIVDLASGHMVAAEALLRWHNPELGEVSPERFIPIAEETGLIHKIGEWVLHEACRIVSTMPIDERFRIAVNLSSKQFNRPKRLLDCVLDALRQSGLMPSQLELEITESILIDDRPEIAQLIRQLDRIGVRLSIDDFGTGYSALNYLQRFPFDVLKIDRSFTGRVPGSQANASLIRAIIAMAHALDLEVVAEGIESRGQAGFLLVHHCELGQGYLYSKPLEPAQFSTLIGSDSALSA